MRTLCFRLLALCLGAGLTSTVYASGFDTARFGSEDGHAAGATPFALYYNPAALATTRKLHIAGDLVFAYHSARYDRTATSSGSGSELENLGKSKVSDLLVAPALATSFHMGDFAVGVGVFAPMAGVQTWKSDRALPSSSALHAGDGSARWHLIEGGMTVLYGSVGAAYTVRPLRLSFGASLSANYTTLEFTRALNLAGDDSLGTEGRAYVDVRGITGSFGVGVLWEALKDQLWLGLSYQSPPGFYGGQSLDGRLRYATGAAPSTEAKVTMYQSLPDIIRFGIRARPRPSYELRLSGDFSRWSTLESQCVAYQDQSCDASGRILDQPRRWKDTFGVRAGGSYFFSPTWEGFLGVGYDGNPIPASTLEASLIEGHDFSGTLGGRVRIGEWLGLLVSYTQQVWRQRDVTGMSRLDQDQDPTLRLPSGDGVYRQWAGQLRAMLEIYID